MFAELTGLGYTIIGFTILVVIGLVVIGQLGASVATQSPIANSTAVTIQGYLGSAGLAGWIPAIIALFIGILFLSAFGFGRGGRV